MSAAWDAVNCHLHKRTVLAAFIRLLYFADVFTYNFSEIPVGSFFQQKGVNHKEN